MNFGFDVYRRYDFEGQRREVQSLVAESHEILEQARFLTQSHNELLERFSQSSHAVAAGLTQIQTGWRDLLRLLQRERPTDFEPAAAIAGESEMSGTGFRGEANSTEGSPTGIPPLVDVMEAPYEVIQELSEAMRDDPLYSRYEAIPHMPKDWDVQRILGAFDAASGMTVDGIDRKILELKVESYRHAASMAMTRYDLELYRTVPERIARGEYQLPDADGNYPETEAVPEDLLLASGFLGGRNLFQWRRSEYPEMDRLQLIQRYIPFLMLKDLSVSLGERSPR
jgi:hypothetical protein